MTTATTTTTALNEYQLNALIKVIEKNNEQLKDISNHLKVLVKYVETLKGV